MLQLVQHRSFNMIYFYGILSKYNWTRRNASLQLRTNCKKEFREIEGKLKNKKIKTENGKKEKEKNKHKTRRERGVLICLMILLTIQSTQPDPILRCVEEEHFASIRFGLLESFSFSGRLHFKVHPFSHFPFPPPYSKIFPLSDTNLSG